MDRRLAVSNANHTSYVRYTDDSRRAYSGDRDRSDRRGWRRPGPSKYESESPERYYQQMHHMGGSSAYRDLNMITPVSESPHSPSAVLPPLTSPLSDISLLKGDDCLHRITFIETHIYQPQDLPSPSHYPRHRIPPQPAAQHQQWMVSSVKQLRTHFALPYHQILMNVERKSKFPFIIYSLANADLATCALSPELRYTDGIYEIVSSICRAGSGFGDDETSRPAGFIVSAFATFPGEDSERLESNWMSWTGISQVLTIDLFAVQRRCEPIRTDLN